MPVIDGIVESHGGQPVAGARVMLVSAPAPAPDVALITTADGRFRIGATRPGVYVISAVDDRHGTITESVTVAADAPPCVVLRLPD